jgi:hypothetical protein
MRFRSEFQERIEDRKMEDSAGPPWPCAILYLLFSILYFFFATKEQSCSH